MILASSRDEGRTWTVLGASTADESDVHLPGNFRSRLECSGFFAHIQRQSAKMVKTCENDAKFGEMVKLEIGEINWHWSDLHVCKSLQQDQQWNKLVKIPVNHEKHLEYLSMKRSNPLVSDTAKRFSWCSVSSCEMSGSGVLLLEWTMWRQKPLNIFQESNAVPSHLLAEFQHKRCILRKS